MSAKVQCCIWWIHPGWIQWTILPIDVQIQAVNQTVLPRLFLSMDDHSMISLQIVLGRCLPIFEFVDPLFRLTQNMLSQ